MTDNSPQNFINDLERPSRLAWLVFRSLARFWASIFLPYFRVWGETDFKPGTIFIARNFGLQTWVYLLRFFRRPVRIVLDDDYDNLKWFNVAKNGGMAPILLSGGVQHKIEVLKELHDKGEIVFLIISRTIGNYMPTFMQEIENNFEADIRFFAVEGANRALPPDTVVPNFASICVFCGRPYLSRLPGEGLLDELEFLESTMVDLDIDEEPSFFRNNRRNQ